MQTKLTLRLEEGLIQRAKSLAKKRGKSVSRVVADYLTVLDIPLRRETMLRWSPLVRSLKGSLRRTRGGAQAYRRYLEDKYR